MSPRITSNDWQRTLCGIIGNPTSKVVAALIVVGIATWTVVQAEVDLRNNPYPVPFVGAHR